MKRALSFVLAATLMVGMSLVASAATPKITDIDSGAMVVDSYDEEMSPGKEIKIELDANAFTFADGKSYDITTSVLKSSDVTLKVTKVKGGEYVEKVEFKNMKVSGSNYAYVSVQLVDTFNSTSEKDVTLKIALQLKRSRKDDVELSFKLKNETIYVSDSDDYISIEDGQIVEAESYVRAIEVYIGNGVTIDAKMYQNKKYYGVCKSEITEEDDKILSRYPEILDILKLTTTNLKGSGKIVTIEPNGDTMHVYNEEGKYIGTTDEKLPYSNVYYLAEEKIKMSSSSSSDDENEDEDNTEEVLPEEGYYPPQAPSPSDSGYVNDNPETGANGLIGFALLTGLLAAAAIKTAGKK